ncbi:MAG: hypothetical protein ABSB82_20325 [Terriglobia bacterium]|jgi:hypothetical protein
MMWKDEIVEEVRAAREAYFAQFDHDLKRMFEDLKKKEALHPERHAKIEPVKPRERPRRPTSTSRRSHIKRGTGAQSPRRPSGRKAAG